MSTSLDGLLIRDLSLDTQVEESPISSGLLLCPSLISNAAQSTACGIINPRGRVYCLPLKLASDGPQTPCSDYVGPISKTLLPIILKISDNRHVTRVG